MFMNGVQTGILVVFIALVRSTILRIYLVALSVCFGAAAGTAMRLTVECLFATTIRQAFAAAMWASALP